MNQNSDIKTQNLENENGKLGTYESVLNELKTNPCDGECNNGSDVCACRFEWKCVKCGKKVVAMGEEVTDMNGECGECFYDFSPFGFEQENWTINREPGTFTYQDYMKIQTDDGNPICDVGGGLPFDEKRMIANANLIVAAPELFAACRSINFLLRANDGTSDTDITISRRDVLLIKAAIARATGDNKTENALRKIIVETDGAHLSELFEVDTVASDND